MSSTGRNSVRPKLALTYFMRMRSLRRFAALLMPIFLRVSSSPLDADESWRMLRGPDGSGVAVRRQSKGMPLMSSPICVGDLVYTVTDSGILHALNHSDGELVWRHRLGGKFSSSPFASGDRLLVGDHAGIITIIRVSDEYHVLARYDLNEQIMASPIAIGDDLILRTKTAVYRFSKPTAGK